MTRDEMLCRFGYYCGLAARLLNDDSYWKRWYGHAEDITEEIYSTEVSEISARLKKAGLIAADEDPWESKL
jgi:hypothetical protein